jgi:DNA-binding NarL/FixJ family response regulator
MRLLLVEDDLSFLGSLERVLTAIPRIELTIAKSKESAIAAIVGNTFDLAVCDLNLPSVDGALDLSFSHGQAVYHHLMDVAPGTPIIVWTGYEEKPIWRELFKAKREADFLGTKRPQDMLDFFKKAEITEFINTIKELSGQFNTLDDIEIIVTNGLSLSHAEKRLLQVFARRVGGHLINVSELGGGHTDSRTLRVFVDGEGGRRATVVAKLGSIALVEDEKGRYEREVAPRLTKVGSHVVLTDGVMDGAGSQASIFYTLDPAFDRSVFALLESTGADSEALILRLKDKTSQWLEGSQSERVSVKEIRQGLISDSTMESVLGYLADISWKTFEDRQVKVRRCCQHGDLQGLNVLVNRQGEPVLIDFGRVGNSTASFDPVVLELSVLFQPAAGELRASWPTKEQARQWTKLDEYVRDCPFAEFIRACRAWAHSVAVGPREIYANVYGYSVLQLKYADTDKDLARSLIIGMIEAF